jgi:hypothetical protein
MWPFKKKISSSEKLLSFNAEELGAQMQQLSVELYRCKEEASIKLVQRMIDTARNIQIIEINRISPNKAKLEQLEHQLGRLAALSDLYNFITGSLDPAVYNERKEAPRKHVRMLQRTSEFSKPII